MGCPDGEPTLSTPIDQTGLYFYNARYYDATIERFISPDSVIPDRTDPQAFNRYSYVVNNPLRYTDPSGSYFVPVNGTQAQLEWFWNELYNLKEIDAYRGSLDTWGRSDTRIELNLAECGAGTDLYTSIVSKVPLDQGGLKGGSNLDKIQSVMDIAGFVPVIGDAVDAINGGIYLCRGQYGNAALSAGAVVPVSGSAATVGKFANKADDVNDAAKIARKANVSKSESPIWKSLGKADSSGVKTTGKGGDKLYYQWDYTHKDIEVYNRHGKHLASMDPATGEWYKPEVPGRTLTR